MALPPGFLDELRARVSIVSVVGRKVTWDPRKSNAARGDHWAPCPFHQEKTASFHVEEAKGRYHCFGCHAGGDVVTFVRETEGLGFMEAVERLAAEAGMEMPAQDPRLAARVAANQGLVEAMEAAVRFFRTQLNGARAAEARAYLDRRGLSPAIQTAFEIGYAPDGRTDLIGHLASKGFTPAVVAEAGLSVAPRDGGKPYDRFRNRITFPIRDARGRAIAFGARAVSAGQEPKYLNSPETPLFDKGRTLYNIGPARAAAGKAGTVVVAEGYMDVIALAEAGIAYAVAPLGTAITSDQLTALWRVVPEPVVALDGDAAGRGAAQRLIDLALPLLGPDRALRFAMLPAGQDPDDLVRAGGAAAIRAVLDASQPMVALLWERETEGQVLDSPERRAALDARLRAHLAKIADPGLRAHWEREIRDRRAALFERPRVARPQPSRRSGPAGVGLGTTRAAAGGPVAGTKSSLLVRGAEAQVEARTRESAILVGCLNHPVVARQVEARLERLAFQCRDLEEIRDALLAGLNDSVETGEALTAWIAARIGRDPRPELMLKVELASRQLRPGADPVRVRRSLDDLLERHAALTGREEENREAAGDAALGDDTVTLRARAALDAVQQAHTSPLEDQTDGDQAERLEFASVVRPPVPRSPRRH